MALTFGKVPHPTFINKPITKPEGFGQNDLGQRTVKGVVWHRMIGHLNGTFQHFSNPTVAALTDYGVGVLAQDGAALDGVIHRYNDPLGRQSGWASGNYTSFAYGDGLAFVNKYGVNAVNRDQASIEISGLTYDVALSEKSRQAIVNLTAYWADQYEIPWDVFPISPQDGFSFVRWHNEFGPEDGRKKCPGAVVMAETPALIERVRAALKAAQETPVPEYATPVGLPFDLATATGWQKLSDIDVFMTTFEDECIKDAIPRAHAGEGAKQSAPKIKVKDVVTFKAIFVNDNKVGFRLMEDGSRILSASFWTNITAKKR